MSKVKVLVVDDSAVVRNVFTDILGNAPGIELLATASDPIFAMKSMEKQWPDVIVLDIEMPRMDGITFLKKIMSERPTPVIICSTLTEKGAETTMNAMAAGAVDIVTKPKLGLRDFLKEQKSMFINTIKSAAQANMNRVSQLMRKRKPSVAMTPTPKLSADAMLSAPNGKAMCMTTESVVAIGTSTGGTQALEAVLRGLPRVSPGVVVVQHMPEKFTRAFAERLNMVCEVEVKEARNGDRLLPGQVLIAPGGLHMMLNRSGAQYIVEVVDGPLVSRHKPSVDVLFRSVAKSAGKNALGIIMTGMGDDGANGLLEMRQAGAETIGQNEATCVVYGMPREAMKRGAVKHEVALHDISGFIVASMGRGDKKQAS